MPPAAAAAPDAQFLADWKAAVGAAVLAELRRVAAFSERRVPVELFERYDLAQVGEERPTYEELAATTGLTAYQVANGLRWARQTYKQLFIQELRDQVASEDELRSEARELFGIRIGE